jgi:hypothetical protein
MGAPKCGGEPDMERQSKFENQPRWEEITWMTYRLSVPGGWLYRYEVTEPVMAFVPDA